MQLTPSENYNNCSDEAERTKHQKYRDAAMFTITSTMAGAALAVSSIEIAEGELPEGAGGIATSILLTAMSVGIWDVMRAGSRAEID